MKKVIGILAAVSFLAVACSLFTAQERITDARLNWRLGDVIHEDRSKYSHIRVRERGTVRSLTFVEDDGQEQRQSSVDMRQPESMQLAYTKAFFASFLFRHPQDRVLIIGLGGGGMVRFLHHHFPRTAIDAVEIDPAVVQVARRFFGTQEKPGTRIHTEDGFEFFQKPHGTYDAIYMDAFLKPEADSGLEVLTQRLKTVAFLKKVRSYLAPGGVVAFNLIEGPEVAEDLMAIREAFQRYYVVEVPQTRNLIVIAPEDDCEVPRELLLARAQALDGSLDMGFSLVAHARRLKGMRDPE